MDWRQNKQAVHCELRSKSFRCWMTMRTLESQRYCGLNTLSVDISVPSRQWQEVRSFSGDLKSGRLFFFFKNGLRTLTSTGRSSHRHEFTRLCRLSCVRLLVLFSYETAERCYRLLEMSKLCFSCLWFTQLDVLLLTGDKGPNIQCEA